MSGYGHALWIWNCFLFTAEEFSRTDFITVHFPIQPAQCGRTVLFYIPSSKIGFQLLMAPTTFVAVILSEFSSPFY